MPLSSNAFSRGAALGVVLTLILATTTHAQQPVDFSTYVAVGDGFTAGFQDGALHEDGQRHAFPLLVAEAAGTATIMPFIGEPGWPTPNSVTGIGLRARKPGTCAYGEFDLASGVTLGRVDPNAKATNVAVPYERLGEAATARWSLAGNAPATFEDFVLGFPYGVSHELPPSTQIETAIALRPTFITVWLGSMDALLAAIAGTVDSGTLTPTGQFEQRANAIFSTLGATGAKGAVLNVPDLTSSGFLVSQRELRHRTHLSSKQLKKKLGVLKSSYVQITALPTIDAIVAGDATGPLAESQILTADEMGRIQNAIDSYNRTLASESRALGWALVDLNAAFATYERRGVDVGGVGVLTTAYLGGIYDLDGIHLSDTGQALVALSVVSAINATYGTALPLPNVASVASTDAHICSGGSPRP